MKTCEKLAIIISLVVAIWSLPDRSNELLVYSMWFLALLYLLGGYWLFNKQDEKTHAATSIIPGIVFFLAIISLPHTIRIERELIYQILPVFNLVFFTYLGVHLLRGLATVSLVKRQLFYRSATIFLITGFFAYAPVDFGLYRVVLKTLNRNWDPLIENMNMHDYRLKAKAALDEGNCEEAIKYSEKSMRAGLAWLQFPELSKGEKSPAFADMLNDSLLEVRYQKESERLDSFRGLKIHRIIGAYTLMYFAYKCKGDKEYYFDNYSGALTYYIKADSVLQEANRNSKPWLEEKATLNAKMDSLRSIINAK